MERAVLINVFPFIFPTQYLLHGDSCKIPLFSNLNPQYYELLLVSVFLYFQKIFLPHITYVYIL